MQKLNLEQAARAVVLCFTADIPVALWGGVGLGKSSIIRQVSDGLRWKLYDYRLSDKEPSDLGGIPYPSDEGWPSQQAGMEALLIEDGKKQEGSKQRKRLTYLMSDNLPFDCEEKAVVFLDEFDRCDLSVQNVALQLVLDRGVNGHKLSKNSRIAIAGNGATDMGTSPLSKAAASRMVHIYVEGESEGALESYLTWAEKNGVSAATRSFARYRKDVWAGNGDGKVEELGTPRKRTFDMADKLIQVSKRVKFPVADVLRAVVEGCVGSAAAVELLAWHKLCDDAPTVEQIRQTPASCKLPQNPGVYYALTITLFAWLADHQTDADAVAEYALRWPEEQAAYLFSKLTEIAPNSATSAAYMQWRKLRN